jgi:cyclase
LITSIDREGTLQGFGYDLFREIGNAVAVHLIFSGGAGSYDDVVWLFKETGCDACAVGKMFFLRDCDMV